MSIKFIVAFTILALTVSLAGTIPAKGPFHTVTITEPATVAGTALKAGEYKVAVNEGKATFISGKNISEVAVKVVNADKKFDTSLVQYEHKGTQTAVTEICLGGTKTRLVFN